MSVYKTESFILHIQPAFIYGADSAQFFYRILHCYHTNALLALISVRNLVYFVSIMRFFYGLVCSITSAAAI